MTTIQKVLITRNQDSDKSTTERIEKYLLCNWLIKSVTPRHVAATTYTENGGFLIVFEKDVYK
jgi:hypothetical protein